MSKVVNLHNESVGAGVHIEPDDILEGAKGKLNECVVFGFDENGELYVASTDGPGDTMWLIEAAKLHLLNGAQS